MYEAVNKVSPKTAEFLANAVQTPIILEGRYDYRTSMLCKVTKGEMQEWGGGKGNNKFSIGNMDLGYFSLSSGLKKNTHTQSVFLC